MATSQKVNYFRNLEQDANKGIRGESKEFLSILQMSPHSESCFPFCLYILSLLVFYLQTINLRSFPRKNNFLLKAANLSTFSCLAGNFPFISIVMIRTKNENTTLRNVLKIAYVGDCTRHRFLRFLR